MDKPIYFSAHAKLQILLRGADENEVIPSIRLGKWEQAKQNKFHASFCFLYNKFSPVNQKFYHNKTVDVVFVDEVDKIVVITVKVYYYN